MSQLYDHRNGESDPPTNLGWYWFEGEASVKNWQFLHTLNHGPTVYGPFDYHSHLIVFRMLDEYMVQPQNAKGRWWGPCLAPQIAAAARTGGDDAAGEAHPIAPTSIP